MFEKTWSKIFLMLVTWMVIKSPYINLNNQLRLLNISYYKFSFSNELAIHNQGFHTSKTVSTLTITCMYNIYIIIHDFHTSVYSPSLSLALIIIFFFLNIEYQVLKSLNTLNYLGSKA